MAQPIIIFMNMQAKVFISIFLAITVYFSQAQNNKPGLANRSEITDAVHAAQAECIMINKGSYTIIVLETLRNIFLRASEHRNKKRFTFRSLNIAKNYLESE